MKRREAIRPSLKTEYAGLCSQNVPVTSLLFGDDLQQQLNNIKASNKISQTSANANKSQRSGYKGNSSDSGKNRSSDQCYKKAYHSQSHWRSRGDKSKKLKLSPLQKEGQELNANVNGLANLETLQVGNFESHVENIKDSVL